MSSLSIPARRIPNAPSQPLVPVLNLNCVLAPPLQELCDAVAQVYHRELPETGQTRVGIAYSGGVDSAVLAALTARILGIENTVLLLGISPSLARREKRLALRQAQQLGLEAVEVHTSELQDSRYAANPVDRCYFCKDELFSSIEEQVWEEHGLRAVAYGENADDSRRPDRPGGRAAREHAVLYPLAEAGLGKDQVRQLARGFGLPSADKPAAPCLASRIPHGQAVTAEKLSQIDAAEDAVLSRGFSDCRVRHHGDLARIEVPVAEVSRFEDARLRSEVEAKLRDLGFSRVSVEQEGLKSGAFTLQILNARGR